MAQRKRDVAIIVLECAIVGFCASGQHAATGAEMVISSKPAGEFFEGVAGSSMRPRLFDARLPESGNAQLFPIILAQPDFVASVPQAIDGYILLAQETKNADAPAEPQAVVQEIKSADAPTEPQAVMRELKSITRLSGSKQRRRKPKMAGVPFGTPAVAQGAEEPGTPVTAQGAEEPRSGVVAQGTKKPELPPVIEGAEKPWSPELAQETEEIDTLYKPLEKGVEFKTAAAGKKRYAMAPIRWGVDLSETVSLERHSQTTHLVDSANSNFTGRGLVHTQTAAVHANTYILQQYLAALNGNIGVNSSKTTSSSSSSSGANCLSDIRGPSGTNCFGGINSFNSNSGRTNQLFGDGTLRLFPRSRFPFTMKLSAFDSRNNAEFVTNSQSEKSLSLDQTYQPRYVRSRGVSMYHLNYSRNTYTYSAFPQGRVVYHSSWLGDYRKKTVEHDVKVNATVNEKFVSAGMDRNSNNFTVTDKYLPNNSLLSLFSMASLYTTIDNNSGSNYLQAYTSAAWQPESEDIPLFVDGGVRLFKTTNTNNNITSASQSLGGNIGGTYIFSRNLTGRADGVVTTANSNGVQNLITTQRGSVSYSPDAIKLWSSVYSWNAMGGAANQTGGGSDSSIFGGLGHGLATPYAAGIFGHKWQLGSDLKQSLFTTESRVGGLSTTIENSGHLYLSPVSLFRPGKELMGAYTRVSGLNTYATLQVIDRRVIAKGQTTTHTTTYFATLSERGGAQYSRSGLKFDVSVGAVQSSRGSKTNLGGGFGLVGTSSVKYTKARVFGVRGLDYAVTLKISKEARRDLTTTGSDPNANNPMLPWMLDQNLRYKVGKNEVMLRGLYSDEYGVKNASLWLLFRAWRTIDY